MKKFIRFVLLCLIFVSFTSPVNAQEGGVEEIRIHSVISQKTDTDQEFLVRVFGSVLNQDNQPMQGLDFEQFTLREDDVDTSLASLGTASDYPFQILLLVDISHSMSGEKLDRMKQALETFVHETDAQFALYRFENTVEQIIPFTDNKDRIINAVNELSVIDQSNTCLYDAINRAVEEISWQPVYRKAVLVLTDGKDELYGQEGNCSSVTLDDTLNKAKSEFYQVPLFSISIGDEGDQDNLRRISDETGGRHLHAVDAADISVQLEKASNQFNSMFYLEYYTQAAPGNHQLYVSYNLDGNSVEDRADFYISDPVVVLTIQSPLQNEENPVDPITAAAVGQNYEIKEAVFFINGTEIGRSNHVPYELVYDFGLLPPGTYQLRIDAVDQYGALITQDQISFIIPGAVGSEEISPTETGSPVQPEPTSEAVVDFGGLPNLDLILLGGGVILVLLIGVGAAAVFFFLKRRKQKETPAFMEPQDSTMDLNSALQQQGGFVSSRFGLLRVKSSEDHNLTGKIFALEGYAVAIGRSDENQIVLAGEKAVSRQHAIIQLSGTDVFVSEIVKEVSDGSISRPTYGTFLNGEKISNIPVLLTSGDEIKLGTTFIAVFEQTSSNNIGGGEELDETLGEFNLDDDKTRLM